QPRRHTTASRAVGAVHHPALGVPVAQLLGRPEPPLDFFLLAVQVAQLPLELVQFRGRQLPAALQLGPDLPLALFDFSQPLLQVHLASHSLESDVLLLPRGALSSALTRRLSSSGVSPGRPAEDAPSGAPRRTTAAWGSHQKRRPYLNFTTTRRPRTSTRSATQRAAAGPCRPLRASAKRSTP